jgi:hypothetical protein
LTPVLLVAGLDDLRPLQESLAGGSLSKGSHDPYCGTLMPLGPSTPSVENHADCGGRWMQGLQILEQRNDIHPGDLVRLAMWHRVCTETAHQQLLTYIRAGHGGAFQWVRGLPGNRSTRQQPEQQRLASWLAVSRPREALTDVRGTPNGSGVARGRHADQERASWTAAGWKSILPP